MKQIQTLMHNMCNCQACWPELPSIPGADDEEFFSAEEDGDHWTEHGASSSSAWKAETLHPNTFITFWINSEGSKRNKSYIAQEFPTEVSNFNRQAAFWNKWRNLRRPPSIETELGEGGVPPAAGTDHGQDCTTCIFVNFWSFLLWNIFAQWWIFDNFCFEYIPHMYH